MDDFLKIKRGETIPLKVNSLATHDENLAAAIKKHGDFNKPVLIGKETTS